MTEAVQPGGAPHKLGFSEWLSGRNEQESPSLFRQRRDPVAETVLDGAGQAWNRSRPESGEFRRAQITGQLEQGQWVAARLSDDSFAHLLVEPEARCRAQQLAGARPPSSVCRPCLGARLSMEGTHAKGHGPAPKECRGSARGARRDAFLPGPHIRCALAGDPFLLTTMRANGSGCPRGRVRRSDPRVAGFTHARPPGFTLDADDRLPLRAGEQPKRTRWIDGPSGDEEVTRRDAETAASA